MILETEKTRKPKDPGLAMYIALKTFLNDIETGVYTIVPQGYDISYNARLLTDIQRLTNAVYEWEQLEEKKADGK